MSWHKTKTTIKQKGNVSSTCIEIYVNDEIVIIRKEKSNDIPVDIEEFTLLIFSRMKMLNIHTKIINTHKFKEIIQNEFMKNNETFKLNTLTLEEHVNNVCNPKNING